MSEEISSLVGSALNAGENIPKVRSLILRAAVAGRLTNPHADDSRLPEGWQILPLGDCVDILDATREPVNEVEREKRIAGKSPSALYPYYGATRQQGWIDGYLFDEELVLLGEDGVQFFDPYKPKAYLVSGRSWINNHAHVLRARKVENRFLCHVLNVADYRGRATGTTRLKLTQGKMIGIPVPVPPPEEQARIITKVHQLMALCDDLEAKEVARRHIGKRFTKAALGGVLAADAPKEFAVAWKRIAKNLREFVDSPEEIPALREALLDAAVRGQLVPQVASDGTAEDLVAEALSRRQVLAEQTSARVSDGVAPVGPEAVPFSIPANWRWVRIATLGGFLGGGTPSKANSEFWDGAIPWVSPKDMKRPYINDAEDHISEAALDGSAAKLIPSCSLLFVVRGMILAHSFPVALSRRDVTINQDMRALVIAVPETGEWLLRVAQAARRRVLAKVERSSHGTCRLDSRVVEEMPVPLPPIREQARIIRTLGELMRLCDALEAKLRERDDQVIKLADALTSKLGGRVPAPSP